MHFFTRHRQRRQKQTVMPTQPPESEDIVRPDPPAYADVPVFDHRLPPEEIPYLPYEILAEVIDYAISPVFDTYAQSLSSVHVETLRSLSLVNSTFLDIVRSVVKQNLPSDILTIPSNKRLLRESADALNLVTSWLPISVFAGAVKLDFFEDIVIDDALLSPRARPDKTTTGGFVSNNTRTIKMAKICNYTFRQLCLVLHIWNRQAMEKFPGVPYEDIFLTLPQSKSPKTVGSSANLSLERVLKTLTACTALRYKYLRIIFRSYTASINVIRDAVRAIAPDKGGYLELHVEITGDIGKLEKLGKKYSGDRDVGFMGTLPLEILELGMRRGAGRVDIKIFRTGGDSDQVFKVEGSLVNFIRTRTVPNELLKGIKGDDGFNKTDAKSNGIFAHVGIEGSLDTKVDAGKMTDLMWKMSMASSVTIHNFGFSIVGVREGEMKWMGSFDDIEAKEFLEMAATSS